MSQSDHIQQIHIYIYHSQLLKRKILKFNSSSIALLNMCISQCCHNRVLYWVYMDPYCIIYQEIWENIAPAARPIRRINSSNIALPGRTLLEVKFLEIENVCIMTQVRIYGDIQPEPLKIPQAPPSGFPLFSGYISPYIPSLVRIQIQYQ